MLSKEFVFFFTYSEKDIERELERSEDNDSSSGK